MNFEKSHVVFVVEKSRTLKRYLPELLENYLSPALSYFSGGINEDTDVFFTQTSQVNYAAVFFGSELNLLRGMGCLESKGPTTSQKTLMSFLQDANYHCTNMTRQAFIYEGLNAALAILKNLASQHCGSNSVGDTVVRRCCILVTQSVPLVQPWMNFVTDTLFQELKMMNVKLSIISPHKLVELAKLFEMAGGEKQSLTLKNYCCKPQHLVLLSGFTLQERPLSPSLVGQTATTSTVQNVIPSQAQMTQVPLVPPVTSSVPTPPQAGMTCPTSSPIPIMSQANQLQQNPAQSQMIRGQSPGMVMSVQQATQGSLAATQMTAGGPIRGPAAQPIPMMPPQPMNQGTPRQRWPQAGNIILQQQQTQVGPQQMMVGQQAGIAMSQGNITMQQQQQQQQTAQVQQQVQGNMLQQVASRPGGNILWQGTIEWQEKKADNMGTINHRIPCRIIPQHQKAEIKTEGWPPTLFVNLVQKSILSSIGQTFFQNVNSVLFNFDPCPALDSLTTSLSRGMAGCIQIPPPVQSEIKMIILLLSVERMTYVGFIPHDQIALVNKIKEIFAAQGRMRKPGVTAGGGMITVGAGQGTPVGAQALQNPAGTGVMTSQGNVVYQQNQPFNQNLTQGMAPSGIMGTGQVSQMGTVQIQQVGHVGGQQMGASGQGGALGQVNANPMVTQSVLASQLIRPSMTLGQQTDQIRMRQTPPQSNLRLQMQQRPGLQQVNLGQGQPRLMQSQMQTTDLRQMLQQQRMQHHHQQQQQLLMMQQQQQQIRPQMSQGQHVMGQGMGQPMQESTDYMDLL